MAFGPSGFQNFRAIVGLLLARAGVVVVPFEVLVYPRARRTQFAGRVGIHKGFAKPVFRVGMRSALFPELHHYARAEEGYEAGQGVDAEQEEGRVAVTDEDLGVSSDQVVVQSVEEPVGVLAADGADNGPDALVSEHAVQVRDALIYSPRRMTVDSTGVFPYDDSEAHFL